jgi:hypothetical protein
MRLVRQRLSKATIFKTICFLFLFGEVSVIYIVPANLFILNYYLSTISVDNFVGKL